MDLYKYSEYDALFLKKITICCLFFKKMHDI